MDVLASCLERRRLIVAAAVLLSLAGLAAWLTMPREEDPRFPQRHGLVLTSFPGADAETVERLVLEPLEEHLTEVEEVNQLESTARAGFAMIEVELLDEIYDTDAAWDEVRDGVERARREFPAGVGKPVVEDDLVSQEAVLLAVTGSTDLLQLKAAAERLKRGLLGISSVKQVKLVADPGEQITVEYDDAVARRLGVDPTQLGRQLGARSHIVPGGLIHLGSKTANLRPHTDFLSVEEIASTPVMLPTGASVPLGELGRVRRGPAEPALERMRWNGVPAVGLGVVPRDKIDRIVFGKAVRERLDELRAAIAPLGVDEVVFQPASVEKRLDDLSRSLRIGILIVTAVLFVAMGLRLGMLVAALLPLVSLTSIGVFATGGGILHQISIAALVLALGMLVDNAIVMVEAIQWRLDNGEPVKQAAAASVRELALPLGTATGTTVAAFVPMLLSKGGTADFTRALPILIILTLTVSYVYAVFVTPVLSELVLRPRGERPARRLAVLPEAVARFAVRRPFLVLVGAVVLVVAALLSSGLVKQQFFPAADRSLVVVDMEMPEGTHLEGTDEVAQRFEAELAALPEVRATAAFVGRSVPKFYYNLPTRPHEPHRAQILLELHKLEDVDRVMAWVRDYARSEVPEMSVVARRLEQGPPVIAPIEVRVFGDDLTELEEATDAVVAAVRATPGAIDVRHDLGLGVPTVGFEIDDAAAGRLGLARADVALAIAGRTLGTEIGQYRAGEDPVPIRVRSSAGEELPVTRLATIDVTPPGGDPVPLAQLARLDVEWRPAAIHHMARSRLVRVLAELAPGTTAHAVQTLLQPRLDALELPAGVRLAFGGELEESGKANSAILRTMPLGVLLLLFFLLAEFNSFRRVGIVLATVPLAAVGVIPGLLLANQPFGFMSMLGMLSLVGIVVNNAIVMLDVVERRREEGLGINEALTEAVKRRTRPILLTMATTVAGLLPLAFSGTLWPPLAWAMISGLLASTVLTLVVVPALYRVLFRDGAVPLASPAVKVAAGTVVVLLALFARSAMAQGLTLGEAMARAAARPLAVAAERRSAAASEAAAAARRAALWPSVGMSVDATARDRDYNFDTPLGGFTLGERESVAGALELRQPVLDPAPRLYGAPAARTEAEAAASAALRTRRELAAEAAQRYVRVLAIDARSRSTEAFVESLRARLHETEERVKAGRTLEADALKVRLDLESAELELLELERDRRVALVDLGRAVGEDGPVEPAFDGGYDRGGGVDVGESLTAALEQRADLRAASLRLEALGLRARAVGAERLPRLTAVARYQQSSGDPFRPEELVEGILQVSWNPFAAGTRAPRRAALEAQRGAAVAELEELRRGVRSEIEAAVARLQTARDAVEVRRRGVELATETLRVEQERHSAGRATTNDLLDAEAALRRQRTLSELARLDVLLAWVGIDLAVGE